MFSTEQRRTAIETFVRFDHSYADTIRELGYPSRQTLRMWWDEYAATGNVPTGKHESDPRFTDEQRHRAVDHYLEHGRSLARTMRALGYPKSREYLCRWIDEIAPGRRKYRGPNPRKSSPAPEAKARIVAELESRDCAATEVARRHGYSRASPYHWRRDIIEGHDGDADGRGRPVSEEYDKLPTDVGKLQEMEEDLRVRVRELQLECDVLEGTRAILKKDPGADPNRLSNREKAELVTLLRPKWRLKDLLAHMGMAKSSYEYVMSASKQNKDRETQVVRRAVVASFRESGGTYGYRRVLKDVNSDEKVKIGEWTVRRAMRSEGLLARNPRKRHRYSSYVGEISEAPTNTCRRDDGTHDFSADAPNELWVTDITEFATPAGKVYLSPVIDCFDGMPVSWSISTSPTAEMANSSLEGACSRLGEDDHPRVHSDRGGHYRWPGWISICERYGLVRSMSRKGCSPDNSRAEGFFGRLKVEFFYGCDWQGVTLEEFAGMLDTYLRWYRDLRMKSDLGYMSPMQYRRKLGLAV